MMIPESISGADFEKLFFKYASKEYSRPKKIRDKQKAIKEILESKVSFRWNPKQPSTEAGLKLYKGVQDYLDEEYKSRLEFYSAIGTSLDWHHGIDGFFRINNFIVALDFSTDGRQSEKKDVMLILDNELRENFNGICKRIADSFKHRLNSKQDSKKIEEVVT